MYVVQLLLVKWIEIINSNNKIPVKKILKTLFFFSIT